MIKKNILAAIILLSITNTSKSEDYKISISKENYKSNISVENYKENITANLPKNRYLCFDILQEEPNSQNGVYSVDIDGDLNSYSSVNIYCDMNNGGWTLYDDFGKESTSRESLNMKAINSIVDLSTAGYTTFVSYVNHSNYPVNDEYISFFVGGSPNEIISRGTIQKTLPNYVNEIRVEVAVLRAGLDVIDVYFGDNHISTTNKTRTGLILQGSGLFQVHENNLSWIDALWIK
jgi:hypothetical protein